MMNKNYYFKDSLQKKLADVTCRKATFLVAPAGYGKTTAMLEALKNQTGAFWFTSMWESHSCSYRRMCKEIEKIDPDSGEKLLTIGYPNRIHVIDVLEILRQVHTEEETYFVIDNYQLLQNEVFDRMVQALIENSCEKLHFIAISQTYGSLKTYIQENIYINLIQKEDLTLERQDISRWYNKQGVSLASRQLEEIYEKTAGWVLSVSMYLDACVELEPMTEVDTAKPLDYVVWNRIPDEKKELLLRLAVFDCWNQELITFMCADYPAAADVSLGLPLITYDNRHRMYYPHDVLRAYLLEKRMVLTAEEQRVFFERAGQWYDSQGMVREAIECYYQGKNYERILAEDLVNLNLEKIHNVTFTDVAQEILEKCPLDIKENHIISYLRLAYVLFAQCRFDAYDALMAQAKEIICRSQDESLYGEWLIMSAFYEFPNVPRMTKIYEKAKTLIPGKCKVIDVREPFMFGCPSMWALFYSEPGHMLETADALDKMIFVYTQLTAGHGTGAECIYRGEAYCVQGRFEDAYILAYKGSYFAEKTGQVTIAYGAAMLLGIIAVYRSDTKGLEEAVEYLENISGSYSYMDNKVLNQVMLDTVRGYLLGLLLKNHQSPEWIGAAEQTEMNLTFTNFMLYQSRVTDLVLERKYKQAIAHTEVLLTFDKQLCSAATKNFMHVGLALCYLAIGNIPKAVHFLDLSLTNCTADKNFSFISRFRKLFAPLFLLPSIYGKHKEAIKEIRNMKTDYAAPDEEKIFQFIQAAHKLPEKLSRREKEIALLAAKGHRNKEIADKLGISEWTVKTHLQSVYNKLNIDRRGRLSDLLQ